MQPIPDQPDLLVAPVAQASPDLWVGGDPVTNWSTAANWTNGVPALSSDVFFQTNGAATDTSTINNIVSSRRKAKRFTAGRRPSRTAP